jgi:hypothetical protein
LAPFPALRGEGCQRVKEPVSRRFFINQKTNPYEAGGIERCKRNISGYKIQAFQSSAVSNSLNIDLLI